mgnify:CR=1 FL=1|jgi:hypothetical protein
MFAAPKRAKRVAALFKPQGYAVFVGVLVKLFVGLAELTPTFFLYDDIATPAGPIVR